jgi:flavin reductase (DIM6/NTAB) family NADH-FMN oxidoreductase RutF
MQVQASALRGRELYRLLTSLIVPRPIAWVGTRSRSGVDNLAPFSFFMGVTSKPPSVAISVARAGREKLKDTATNIFDTGVFTVSIPSVEHLSSVARSGAAYPSDHSEFDATGLTPVAGALVTAPYPSEAGVALECRSIHTHDLGTAHLIVGEVVMFHIQDHLVVDQDGRLQVDARRLDPLSRLGGLDYAGLGPSLQAAIPSVEDPG